MEIKKCYIDNWLFFDENLVKDNSIFIEIGSFTGNHVKGIKRKYPNSNVIVYEASQKNFKLLKENTKNEDIILYNKGIGEKKEIKKFYDFKTPSSSSIFKRKNRSLHRSSEINFITLTDVLKENNIPHIDVLFMNCEGSELNILNYILENTEIQKKIKQISISFHPQIYGQEKIKKMKLKIEENGYYSFTNNKKWPCTLIIKK